MRGDGMWWALSSASNERTVDSHAGSWKTEAGDGNAPGYIAFPLARGRSQAVAVMLATSTRGFGGLGGASSTFGIVVNRWRRLTLVAPVSG